MNLDPWLDELVTDGSDKSDIREEFISSLTNAELSLFILSDMMQLQCIGSSAQRESDERINEKFRKWWAKRNEMV